MRFTNKTTWEGKDLYTINPENENDAGLKLAHLEDMEEDMGIEFSVAYKAMKYGIVVKQNGEEYKFDGLIMDLNSKCFIQIVGDEEVETFEFDDYGEGWELADGTCEDNKMERAIEIINNKNVDIRRLKNSISYDLYNIGVNFKDEIITEDEFNLLKKYLKR